MALRRTCRCTEFHRVKNANLRHPSAVMCYMLSNLKSGGVKWVNLYAYHFKILNKTSRSQWPHVLRRGSAVSHLLGFWVRIPPGAWMSVFCECCVLSHRVPCDRPIPPTECVYACASVCVCVCVCVSMSAIRCIYNPLHLQWVCIKRSDQERKNNTPLDDSMSTAVTDRANCIQTVYWSQHW